MRAKVLIRHNGPINYVDPRRGMEKRFSAAWRRFTRACAMLLAFENSHIIRASITIQYSHKWRVASESREAILRLIDW